MMIKKNHLILAVVALLLIFGGLFGGGTTAYAQTTGTADGTYDFGGAGDPDSAGTGFTALGDKFKIDNGKFLYMFGKESGDHTAIIPNAGGTSEYTLDIYAEGGSVCKSFTFQDLGISTPEDTGGYTLQNIKLVFKDGYGNIIHEDFFAAPEMELPYNHVEQLSNLTGHGPWNVRSVATVEIVYAVLYNGSADSPVYLQLENMTIAGVSNIINDPPEARNVYFSGGLAYNGTLSGSYEYYDAEEDPEATPAFQWYRSDKEDGTGKKAIEGATAETYAIQKADLTKWISFEVTPAAQSGTSPGYPAETARSYIPGPTITVTFDPNGGSVSPSSQTKRYGWTYGQNGNSGKNETLPHPAFPGHTFDGWYFNGTDKITDDKTVDTLTDITLTPYWITDFYSITYDGNGATGGRAPEDGRSLIYDQNVEVFGLDDPIDPLYKTGYHFTGWNTSADGNGTSISPGDIISIKGNTILYAQWDPNTYTVTFDAQGGTVSPGSLSIRYGQLYGERDGYWAVLPQPQKYGYTSRGWYTGINGTGDQIDMYTRMQTASNQTLYAYWEARSHGVYLYWHCPVIVWSKFDLQYKTYGSTYGKKWDGTDEPLPKLTAYGYTFLGWYTEDGGVHYTDNTVVTVDEDEYLYGQWKPKKCSVTFDPEGGAVPVPSQTKLFASPYGTDEDGVSSEALPVPTKEGYIFGGWWTGDNGTDTQVTDETTVSNEDHTLHAKWLYDLNPITDLELNRLYFGYAGSQETKTVTISGTTGDEIKNISVWLDGADADRFVVTQPQPGTINSASPSAAFTVRAKDGLPIGTFTATVVVSAENTDESRFTVTQTVSPRPSTGMLVRTVVFDGKQTVAGATVTINGITLITGADGSAVFVLGGGTYAYRTSKAGYEDTQGEFTVDGSARPACLLLRKQGDTLLPDTNGGGLILITGNGGYSPGLTLSVVAVQPGANDISAIKLLNGNYEVVSMFDINLLMSSHITEPNSPVTIGIPLPSGLEGKTLKVVRENDDGTVVEFDTVVVGNMLFFTTDHLSRYAVVSVDNPQPSPSPYPSPSTGPDANVTTPDGNPAGSGNPKTGDNSPIFLWIMLMAGSLAGCILALRLKKHIQ
jgi:uncharacterized repeat protein (TIGR02543 family)